MHLFYLSQSETSVRFIEVYELMVPGGQAADMIGMAAWMSGVGLMASPQRTRPSGDVFHAVAAMKRKSGLGRQVRRERLLLLRIWVRAKR